MSFGTNRRRSSLERLKRDLHSRDWVVFVESIIAIVVVWAVLAHGLNLVEMISSPELIVAEAARIIVSGIFLEHLVDTLVRTAWGFAIAILVGTPIGIAIGLSDFLETAFQDFITIGLALADLLVAVFAAMWFGTSMWTPAVAAVFLSTPYLVQTLSEGVDDIDADKLEMSQSFDVSRRRTIRRIVFPSVLSEWFTGVRYTLALSWKAVTLAELIASETGVGFMIRRQMDTLSLTGAFAWTFLFIVVLLVIEYGILGQIEKRVFAWREDTTGIVAV